MGGMSGGGLWLLSYFPKPDQQFPIWNSLGSRVLRAPRFSSLFCSPSPRDFCARRLPRPGRGVSALSFLLRSELSTFNCQLSTSAFHAQLPHQIRNNHLPENHRVRPHFHLPSQMSALRIDPSLLGHIAAAEDQINVGNRNLRVQNSGENQHRRGRFSEELLIHEGQLG